MKNTISNQIQGEDNDMVITICFADEVQKARESKSSKKILEGVVDWI